MSDDDFDHDAVQLAADESIVRCPVCHDLFVADENGLVPSHYLDLQDGMPRCGGSCSKGDSK